ncbi:MAG TPA: hypothetical protein PKK06_10050 [Phycisphaerae bacterium]|nr:hypothetical protein [Phycisphaerae bacterium]HNU45632.1 hypothetical protein [Phycisphaerae bacterium]
MCAAGVSAAATLLGATPAAAARGSEESKPPASAKAKVGLVFTHRPPEEPTWPNRGYDYEGRKRELTERLRLACPSIDFVPTTVQNAEEATKLLESAQDLDGFVVYMVGIWTGAGRAIAVTKRPTIFVDDLYAGSGEFLIEYSRARREELPVVGVASSRFEDVADAVNCFDCLAQLRSATILDVMDHAPPPTAAAITDVCGTRVQRVTSDEFKQAYDAADVQEARQWAQRWMSEAEKVVEPSREVIEQSGHMYVTMRNLMQQHGARAITIDCLGLLYGGKLPAYPCLGYSQLNNDGFIGACESDLRSTITMLAGTSLIGRPGFISDPVIDTAKNQIIYAHCVAPTKVYGPTGPTNPCHIRSHSEDRKGAVLRSLMPLNETVTTALLDPTRRAMVMHQGKSVENVDEDKACRTKLACTVPDAEKLLADWDLWRWHRVTFYGDHKRRFTQLATLLGCKVVQEG